MRKYIQCFTLILSLVIITTWVTMKFLNREKHVPTEVTFVKQEPPEEIQCNYWFPKLIKDGGNILLRKEVDYPNPKLYDCCYGAINWKDSYSGYLEKNETCTNFVSSVEVNDIFGYVKCNMSEHVIYEDFYFFLNNHKLDFKPLNGTSSPISVILLILGQVSQDVFHKKFPKTEKYLKDTLLGQEFSSLKPRGTTYDNLKQLIHGSNPHNTDAIWFEYARAGYLTAYGDDCVDSEAKLTPPNVLQDRFYPLDFNWESFYAVGRSHIGNQARPAAAGGCLGAQPTYARLLDYVGQYVRLRRGGGGGSSSSGGNPRPLFGVFYIDAALRYDRGNLQHADRRLLRFFRTASTYFAGDTALMLVGDNAVAERRAANDDRATAGGSWRGGNYVKSPPLFYFLLPISYKIEYPDAAEALEWHSKKTVTYADIHSTLRDLITTQGRRVTGGNGLLKKPPLGRVGANRGL